MRLIQLLNFVFIFIKSKCVLPVRNLPLNWIPGHSLMQIYEVADIAIRESSAQLFQGSEFVIDVTSTTVTGQKILSK